MLDANAEAIVVDHLGRVSATAGIDEFLSGVSLPSHLDGRVPA